MNTELDTHEYPLAFHPHPDYSGPLASLPILPTYSTVRTFFRSMFARMSTLSPPPIHTSTHYRTHFHYDQE